jgi:thiol-disulfide isomerase/thioredoxin
MRFLIIFIFFLSSASASEVPNIKNIVINKELKTYNNLTFLDSRGKNVKLEDLKGKLVLLNFWATWCAPCKEEMPSLDSLQINPDLKNLEIIPINVGKDSLEKANKFFDDIKINNLSIYFDTPVTLAKQLSLRGIPTTILFNKEGKEFARIIGAINFSDAKFIEWLSAYN